MKAKELSKDLQKAVIYQLFLRSFTREGTISAAEKMLDSIKDLGADIVYLCPVCEADGDENSDHWSDRQNQSGLKNSKNPYRMKDYFKIDPEYGTENDLKRFVATAHGLGLKIMLDLVYFHCGPAAVFLETNPDFVMHKEDGSIDCGQWNFPRLNFQSERLREYLFKNMEYFVKEFDVDGYRTDVGDCVPLDFWQEGIRRVKQIKPDLIMLNEGTNPAYLKDAFDINYDFEWSFAMSQVFSGEKRADALVSLWREHDGKIRNNHVLRAFDNHDIANDDYDNRVELKVGTDGTEAMLVLSFAIDGTPFLYNGVEVCDSSRHSIYSNRFFGKNCYVNWENALTRQGKRRRAVIKQLCRLKKSVPALNGGSVRWVENTAQDRVLSFLRKNEGTVLTVVNTGKNFAEAEIHESFSGTPLIMRGAAVRAENGKTMASLMPHGYIVLSIN